jgi:hypothetical protein
MTCPTCGVPGEWWRTPPTRKHEATPVCDYCWLDVGPGHLHTRAAEGDVQGSKEGPLTEGLLMWGAGQLKGKWHNRKREV